MTAAETPTRLNRDVVLPPLVRRFRDGHSTIEQAVTEAYEHGLRIGIEIGRQEEGDNAEREQQARREEVGATLRAARGARRWSVEKAACEARISNMAWRRVERGNEVRDATYAALDTLFNLPAGTFLRAVTTDTGQAALTSWLTS